MFHFFCYISKSDNILCLQNTKPCTQKRLSFYLELNSIDVQKWYTLNFPDLTFWEYLHLFWLIAFSFFNWGVVQIFSNWYVFYAKHRYNASVAIASFQIAVSIIFVALGVVVSTKLNKYICCTNINQNDNFLKQIEKNAQFILLLTTFTAIFVSYSCIYVESSYTMWILVPCCTFLLGMVHQCLIVLYLAIQPPKNAGFILGMKYISRNFGAANCSLFVGYMLHYNLNWFWISFTLCIGMEFGIVVCMYLSHWIRLKHEKK